MKEQEKSLSFLEVLFAMFITCKIGSIGAFAQFNWFIVFMPIILEWVIAFAMLTSIMRKASRMLGKWIAKVHVAYEVWLIRKKLAKEKGVRK